MSVIAKGLEGIVANSTSLSDVLGKQGVLIYAGYDIDELAGKASYEEIVYLLWHGALPNRPQLDELKAQLSSERELPQGVLDFIKSAPIRCEPNGRHAHGRFDAWVYMTAASARKPAVKMRITAAQSASPPRSG